MKSAFVISTPFQLLSALEAKSYFKLSVKKSELIVIQYQTLKTVSPDIGIVQMTKLINLGEWNNVYVVGGNESDFFYQFGRIRHVSKLAKKVGKLERIFTSNKDSILINRLIGKTKTREVVLLDDGLNASLENKNKLILKYEHSFKGRMLRRINTSLNGGVKYSCFSAFPKNRFGIEHVMHQFKYLGNFQSNCVVKDEVWLIGSAIGGRWLNVEKFIEYIEKAKDKFQNKKIVFIPHRFEDKVVMSRIRNELQIEVNQLDLPIEYYIIQKKVLPKIMAAFVSTALYSCYKMFNRIEVFYSIYLEPKDFVDIERRNQFESHYKFYYSINDKKFSVIKLN